MSKTHGYESYSLIKFILTPENPYLFFSFLIVIILLFEEESTKEEDIGGKTPYDLH